MRTNLGAPIYLNFMLVIALHGDSAENQLGRRHWNSEGGKSARDWLVEEDLIEHVRQRIDYGSGEVYETYKAKPRGHMWLEHACTTPLPVSGGWVRGETYLGSPGLLTCTQAR